MLDVMKLGILVCGLCGLASAFVGGDHGVWAAREAMLPSVLAYVAGFALLAAVGAWGVKRPPMQRHHAVLGLIGLALVLFWWRDAYRELLTLAPLRDLSLAGLLFSVGFYGGAACTVGVYAKPDPV